MKKIIACISLVFAMSAGVTALADVEYDKDTNSVTPIGEGYKTVLIEKDATADATKETVFVDQNDSGFESSTSFLLKGNELTDGTYTVKMGGHATAAPISDTFIITSFKEKTVEMTIQNKVDDKDADTYQIGVFDTVVANDCQYIVVEATRTADSLTKYGYFETGFTGDGNVAFAAKITGIPDGVNVKVSYTNVTPEINNQ